MKADLHIHSTFSDGSDGIDKIISMGMDKGLDLIAITDHDTLEHSIISPPCDGMRVIMGIEISAFSNKSNAKAHVLGYGVAKPQIVTDLTRPILERRNRNSEKQADILIRLGYRIEMEKLKRAGGKFLYKQHIMDWLVTTGQVPDMYGEFYYSTFKNGGACDFSIDYVDAIEAVSAIKEAGGFAVLAHPGQQKNYSLIADLASVGLDGLEVNHRANNDEDMEIIRDFAGRYRLFLTGGSDYHGKYASRPINLGDILADESGVNAIIKAI